MKIIAAIVLAAVLCIGPSALTARGEQTPPLQWLLNRVPQSTFTDGYLSYVDYQAVVALQPGAKAPASWEEAPAHQGTPAGQAYMRALRGVSSGFRNLLMYISLPEVHTSTGLDPFLVKQSMAVGMGDQQVWLRGLIEEEAMRQALEGKGYKPVDDSGALSLWCEGAACDGGNLVDLSRRDPAFLFGGDLGRFWPVAWRGDLVVSSRDEQAIRLIAAGEGPMLGQTEAFRALMQAATQPDGETAAQVIQLQVIPHPAAEPGALLAFVQAASADALWVVVTLPWQGPTDAQSLEAIKQQLEEAPLAGRGMDTLKHEADIRGGALQKPWLAQADGTTLLVLPFRFAPPDEAAQRNPDAPASLPYQWFVDRLVREDLTWLPTP